MICEAVRSFAALRMTAVIAGDGDLVARECSEILSAAKDDSRHLIGEDV
jgi:hypothetical protein